ncbi:MAG: lycopene cyclase domain-containing protein [Bacteroidia bacterium]
MALTYLLLNIGTIGSTMALSFDRKVAFFRQWGALFPAIAIVGAVFIVWDIWFARMGVWSFNYDYLTGWSLIGLPVEEWMFFVTVPYACVFVYACIKAYLPGDFSGRINQWVSYAILSISVLLGIIHLDKWYTSTTFLMLAILMAINIWIIKPSYIGRFFVSYAICLIPFLLVNGILTSLPVVVYNDMENLGIRLGSIPVEDTAYGFILQLANVNIFEFLLSPRGEQAHARIISDSEQTD